ncbi:hypothetical protein [Hymenobacter sp.]|uniref:hypothetical protein n=1 Tax=Hymenobacter sp. TaxID=1898978 RepID=UPI00286B5EAB|nr:hypothetical protein [Hymenobacter sp.]
MLYSLLPATGYGLAGLKTLLLAPWSGAATYAYATAECSHLVSFSGLSGWQQLPCQPPAACEFGEAYALTEQGPAHAQAVNVALAGLSAAQRTAVQALATAGPLVALCQDYAGQWWLYGQTQGLRLLAAAARGGVFGGESGRTLALTGAQREAARTVAQSRINLLFNAATAFTYPT